ncbi:hypothetical protein I79_024774 [Cricetulus griseus]|uniref:Uncharacterized protein n=1 Tax=Cricetulus griseus TaxID=10029 RepID=G3ILK6_CRIGR|nr:hypothetical protein I79_024774 [Cricetulus griseus]
MPAGSNEPDGVLSYQPGFQECPRGSGEALVGRQGALRAAGEGDLGQSPEQLSPPHPLHRLLPGVLEQ